MLLAPSNSSLKAAEARFDVLLHPKPHGILHRDHVSPKQSLEYAQQLFAFADALIANPALLAFCTDQASTPAMKRKMLDRLLEGKVDLPLVAEIAELLEARWRTPQDLTTAVECLGVYCAISSINHDHRSHKVEGELFQLATAMKSAPDASNFLSNHTEPLASRIQLVNSLLAGKADPATLLLAQRATTNPLAGRFRATLNDVLSKIATSRDLVVAKVFSPIELSDHQTKRLQQLLTKKYGREVEINVSVDPAVIGGLRVEVGDRVLDDTYRARLYDAERHFAEGARIPGDLEAESFLNARMELTNA